jgi:hypothetical protein
MTAMRVFAISNRGLAVIGILVAVLWSLIYAERTLTLRAQQDYLEVMRSLTTTPVKTQPVPSKPGFSGHAAQA